VERARRGDEEAYSALVAALVDRCVAVAYRILRDFDLAEDAVQVTFVAAWRDLPTLREPDRFEAWLHRMLVNACYAEIRRSRRAVGQVRVLAVAAAYQHDDVLTVDDRDQLDRGFRKLSPEQRAVLVFHHFLGLSIAEVAEHMNIPLGTAKSRLHYASLALRAAVEADDRTHRTSTERLA